MIQPGLEDLSKPNPVRMMEEEEEGGQNRHLLLLLLLLLDEVQASSRKIWEKLGIVWCLGVGGGEGLVVVFRCVET